MTQKTMRLQDFLTESQIKALMAMGTPSAKEICKTIIAPNIAEINRKLGQQNDPMYLAYACEYALLMATRTKGKDL